MSKKKMVVTNEKAFEIKVDGDGNIANKNDLLRFGFKQIIERKMEDGQIGKFKGRKLLVSLALARTGKQLLHWHNKNERIVFPNGMEDEAEDFMIRCEGAIPNDLKDMIRDEEGNYYSDRKSDLKGFKGELTQKFIRSFNRGVISEQKLIELQDAVADSNTGEDLVAVIDYHKAALDNSLKKALMDMSGLDEEAAIKRLEELHHMADMATPEQIKEITDEVENNNDVYGELKEFIRSQETTINREETK